jgi:hypothetical protein
MVEAVESPDIDTFNIWGDETDAKPKRNIVNQTFGLFSKITKAIEQVVENNLVNDGRDLHQEQEIIKQPGLSRTELPVIVREENVTLDEFNLMYSKGLSKVLKEKIFKGGLTIKARPIAWKRILGLIDDQHINTGIHDHTVNYQSLLSDI